MSHVGLSCCYNLAITGFKLTVSLAGRNLGSVPNWYSTEVVIPHLVLGQSAHLGPLSIATVGFGPECTDVKIRTNLPCIRFYHFPGSPQKHLTLEVVWLPVSDRCVTLKLVQTKSVTHRALTGSQSTSGPCCWIAAGGFGVEKETFLRSLLFSPLQITHKLV